MATIAALKANISELVVDKASFDVLWKETGEISYLNARTAASNQLAAETERLAGKEAELRSLKSAKPAAGPNKNLFSWIKSFEGFEQHKYKYFRLAKSTFSQRLGRDESLRVAYNLFTDQLQSVEMNPRHPLKAVVGAPGSGKSFFLDELGSFYPDDINKFCDNSLREPFKSALSISISYNGDTPVSNPYDRADAGLQARILYKYAFSLALFVQVCDIFSTSMLSRLLCSFKFVTFFDTYINVLRPDVTFAEFFDEFLETDYLKHSVQACVRFVASHFFSGSLSSVNVFFLGVDEVSKSKSEDDVLSSVGALADTPLLLAKRSQLKILPMVTSLSKNFIASSMTKSNRTIDLIPLPSALDGAAQAMIQELGLKHGPVVEMMCRDVGNHGRMLEYIYGELKQGGTRNSFTGISDFRDAMNAVPRISTIVEERGSPYFGRLRRSPLALYNAVGTAILGSRVSVDDRPSQDSPAYGELQASGVFLGDNSSTDRDFITPVMSPLQISVWANCVMGLKGCPPDLYDTAMNLKRIFLPRAEHSWQDFEYFHRGFEFVRRRFLGNVTVRQFYSLDEDSDENALSDNPSPILDFVMDNSDVRILERASEKWDWIRTRPGNIPGTTSIQLAAEGQTVCDLATLQKIIKIESQRLNPPELQSNAKDSAPSVLILVQNKWIFKENQMDTDRSNWLDEVDVAERHRGTGPDRLYVYAAARRVPSLQKRERHISNVVILGLEDLKRLYGPTVSGAHCFQLQSIAAGLN